MENIYQSISERTGGNIYIGVVGPVRSGKSTFIKSLMEQMVLPNIDNVYLKERTRDELPQCGSGKTIMTAEPKFVPEEAVRIELAGNASLNVRMVDCVGYMIDGAGGQSEDGAPRMVTTPWFDHEVPLTLAAETGTKKVITEHSTIAVAVTTDGSFTDLPRESYEQAEERIIKDLKDSKKPFGLILNCREPESENSISLCRELEEKYGVSCVAVNCQELKSGDIENILSAVLYEFPVKEVCFSLPEWLWGMDETADLTAGIYEDVLNCCADVKIMRQARDIECARDRKAVSSIRLEGMDLGSGTVSASIDVPKAVFYEMLSRSSGMNITSEGQILPLMREFAETRREYERISSALEQVRQTGYGIVMPEMRELSFETPEIIEQSGRYGVRLRATAPSIHMIRADIRTEVCPLVGSEKQSEDLVKYLLREFEDAPDNIWQSNIFGKSLSELVNEGLNNKLNKMPSEARVKLQQTLQRIINEGSSGLICIIL